MSIKGAQKLSCTLSLWRNTAQPLCFSLQWHGATSPWPRYVRGVGRYSGRINKSEAIFNSHPDDRRSYRHHKKKSASLQVDLAGVPANVRITARTGWKHRATQEGASCESGATSNSYNGCPATFPDLTHSYLRLPCARRLGCCRMKLLSQLFDRI
jgi:hypothetical protein